MRVVRISNHYFTSPYYVDSFTYQGRQYNALPQDWSGYQDYSYYWNGWWLTIVTMTTVGFGDFFPVTYFGRLAIIVACFVGIFIISLTMVTMNNSKDYSTMEGKSFVLLRRITQRVIVNRFAGLSVLNFLKSVKSKHKLNRNPDNPIHKNDLIQAEETLERLIEQFRALRNELKPEEVPQEEKIRIILERLNGDVQRIAEELIQHQKNFHLIDTFVHSQQQAMAQLKIKLTNFKKLDILIGRLNFASKFGPLKVISLTKNLQEQDQEVQDIQMAQRQKSEILKRFKPIKKKDIRNIINEVSDHGDSMSKDLIHGKIQRIHRILQDLEDEEEKASEQVSKSFTSRSSTFSGGLLTSKNTKQKRPYFEIKEQTEESVSLNDEQENKVESFKDDESSNVVNGKKPMISDSILKQFTTIARPYSRMDHNPLQRATTAFQGKKKRKSSDFPNKPPMRRMKSSIDQTHEKQAQMDRSQPISKKGKSSKDYMNKVKKEQPFMIKQNNIEMRKKRQEQQELNQRIQDYDQQFVIRRNQQPLAYYDEILGESKQRKGYKPAYIQKQQEDKIKRPTTADGRVKGPIIGNFVHHYKQQQTQQQLDYDDMIKQFAALGLQTQNQYNQLLTQTVVQTVRPTSEQTRARSDSRSGLGAFNKALRQYLKPPGP